ncbi:glycerol uptake facilitator protein [Amycolatopsis mediterranei S699]|uniref:Glycerol uptake facilitator protein n=2 Tax=Amycolatopsis mediterranei TaxID=33910 RepID=A0A0H3D7C3_AMYMU|nr:MIP/aquaporin family protein [Amycolatopsis mediterranei]ADJ46850.1 glycerol uptake facilitator protein [Amycolatopsis mediterranei U32]AEK43657.1 glycerol uptake facilitator protein [Amycolatopsis mediterranei S699]AFO78561.1 glycerol uptake facilitator protein [Amycolatopsis mediterranei S699]AGT85689.1 glycerol uptake facilitator protein [Amycolatopsis mediterranei RB]KDO04717.1 glycerol transporter [Amycolatopsis mediterranei]
MDTSLVRRLVAELAGTAILCLFGIGAAVAVAAARAGGPGLLIVALAHGLALAVAIYAFGSVSGGHFNPTVTVALAARGRFSWREVPAYVVAQLAGGVLGAALVYATYADTATAAGLGATTFGAGAGYVQALVAEAIGAFILVTAVFALAVAPDAPRGVAGIGIGLALATQIMVFGPLTGASVNLARTFGPDIVLFFAGQGVAWSQLFAYLAGPLVGGLAAAFLSDYLVTRRPAVEAGV